MHLKSPRSNNLIPTKGQPSKDKSQKSKKQNSKEPNAALKGLRRLCSCFLPKIDEDDNKRAHELLGPQPKNKMGWKTLVLDLDETLVHSSFEPNSRANFQVQITTDGRKQSVWVLKRPGLEKFLKSMSEIFEVVVFTASRQEYAMSIIDQINVDKTIDHQLFRESCTSHRGTFVKDLSRLGRNLKDVIIVDNTDSSFRFQPGNAVFIESFYNDPNDTALDDWTELLELLSQVNDVRPLKKWKEKFDQKDVFEYFDMKAVKRIYYPKQNQDYFKKAEITTKEVIVLSGSLSRASSGKLVFPNDEEPPTALRLGQGYKEGDKQKDSPMGKSRLNQQKTQDQININLEAASENPDEEREKPDLFSPSMRKPRK
eukprot:TRINITY_DN10661_c0_g2_i2.p1 TRINITY_DN10661_c0_g2~~TRINITY_DN10661_c0_g2_i2.p1  ORF type:complete len:370 (+),score=55.65 TRINITY_DN10661_c0_g2_i2:129-1238(+)